MYKCRDCVDSATDSSWRGDALFRSFQTIDFGLFVCPWEVSSTETVTWVTFMIPSAV